MKFKYECKSCGKCCKFYKVVINIVDVLTLFHFQNCKFSETFRFMNVDELKNDDKLYVPFNIKKEKYYIGMLDENSTCVLLKDNKCSVHQYKPYVCYFYPINYKDEKFFLDKYDICNAVYGNKETEWADLEEKFDLYNHHIAWNNEMAEFWNKYYDDTYDEKDFLIFLYESLYPIYLKDILKTIKVKKQILGE